MFKNFIWDLDGTLIDTDECIIKCYVNILKQYNINENTNKILNLIKEGSKLKAVEYLISKYKAFTKEEFFEKYDKIDKMKEIYNDVKPIKYAIEICDYIKKKGYKNIIITNRGENTVDILKKLDMDKYFDFIMFYGKDNVFVRKPESGMFDYVIKKYNLNIKETLSIGDRTIDYIASKKSNLPVCLFNAIYDKEVVHPEFDIKSLIDIKNIIERGMNNDEKKLIESLGEIITVENIHNSKIKNVLEGEFSYNNKKIKAYIIGNNLHIEKKKFKGKIVSVIELKENNEERIVVVEKENNYLSSYSQITGVFRDVEELKNAKFKCLYETSAGVVIYMIKDGEPYYLVTYSKKNFSGFPKGHIEYGESEEIAAKREVFEEVGVNVELKQNFKSSISYTVFDTPIQKEVIFFLGEIGENTEINIDINEINKYEIVNYEQAKLILNDELMNVLTEAKKYIESI